MKYLIGLHKPEGRKQEEGWRKEGGQVGGKKEEEERKKRRQEKDLVGGEHVVEGGLKRSMISDFLSNAGRKTLG